MDGLGEEERIDFADELEGGAAFVATEDGEGAGDTEEDGAASAQGDRLFEFVAAKAGEFGADGIEGEGALDDSENRAVVPVEELVGGEHSRADVHEEELKDLGGDIGAEAGLEDGEAIDGEDGDERAWGLARFVEGTFDGEAGKEFESVFDGFESDGVRGGGGVRSGSGVGFCFRVVAEGGQAVGELLFEGSEVGAWGSVFKLLGEDFEAIDGVVAREGDGGDGIGEEGDHLLPIMLLDADAATGVGGVVLNDLGEGAGGDEDIVGVGVGGERFRVAVDFGFKAFSRVDVGFDHVDTERGEDHLQRPSKGVGLPTVPGVIE